MYLNISISQSLTRQGIDKIQAKEQIYVDYEVIRCEANYAVFKAKAQKDGTMIQTFGSALKGETFKDGTLIVGM
jgi:3-phenylpropionate/cinnamic acid dioxygenase small subunit